MSETLVDVKLESEVKLPVLYVRVNKACALATNAANEYFRPCRFEERNTFSC
jgi:hypothetical protein